MIHAIPKVTLRQLAYFVAVAEVGSFRAAARTLNVSQPPLSQQIQALETTLGVQLFDRRNKSGFLTDAGEQLLIVAKQTLTNLAEGTVHLNALGRGLAGRLKIGMTEDFLSGPLMARLISFMRDNATIDIETHVALRPELLEQMEAGKLDVVLLTGHLPDDMTHLNRIDLALSRIVAVVSVDHRLAKCKSIALSDLTGETIIPMPSDLQSNLCASLISAVPDSTTRHPSSNTSIALQLTRAGIGIVLTTEHSIVTTAGLQVLQIDDDRAQLPSIMLSKMSSYSPALRNLLDALTTNTEI